MKVLNTYREVIQAILDGYVVEYWDVRSGSWVLYDVIYCYSKDLDEEIVIEKYRIRPSKPSIDWSQVSENFRYLARDKDGSVYLYKLEPELATKSWYPRHGESRDFIRAEAFKSLVAGNCGWYESLIERPEDQ